MGVSGKFKGIDETYTVVSGNPVIAMLDLMGCGMEFEVMDMPRTERKYYYDRDGEIRHDGEGEERDPAVNGE